MLFWNGFSQFDALTKSRYSKTARIMLYSHWGMPGTRKLALEHIHIFPFIRVLLEIFRNTNCRCAKWDFDLKVELRYFFDLHRPLKLLNRERKVQLKKGNSPPSLIILVFTYNYFDFPDFPKISFHLPEMLEVG